VGERYAELTATIVLAPILLVFAEALPKSLFQAHANGLVYPLSWPLQLAYWALLPLSSILRAVTYAASRLAGEPSRRSWELSEQRLHYFFSESAREGVLSAQQNVMARNIMKLPDVRVRDVLIPLDDIIMVPLDGSFDDLRRAAMQRPHTRLLVYEGQRDRIAGAVNLIDFLCADKEPSVAEMVRSLPRICSELPIDEALVELQKARQAMGVVVDAGDQALGIVTVKDLVEGVVGELHEW